MEEVIEGVERFQQEFFSKQKDLFAKLSHNQHPKTFFLLFRLKDGSRAVDATKSRIAFCSA